jgi:methionyl-tRNA synthetase
MPEKFYITTPIYYPSDKLHIGHSYTTVAADAMARYKRMTGYDVMFLTGMDEHGQKIQKKAKEAGISPKEYVDGMAKDIKALWKILNISNDRFIRTTDEYHEKAVQKIFRKLYDKGDIYKGNYEGWYCTPCESFWKENQLAAGKCPDCGRDVELTSEECYFFRLSKYQDRIIDLLKNRKGFIEPESRANEMLNNFLYPGLDDLCVSRTSFSWGIPVDLDPKHVIYVWIDALSNYITALGYMQEDDSAFRKFWPADIQLVGKEIVRFHAVIWPAILMALDLEMPEKIFGHGWLLMSGGKMSKSVGNVVDPVILADRYGADAIRYFLLREVPFGADGLFSNDALVNRINSDLANDLGNLVSRTTAMAVKYFNGKIPNDRTGSKFDCVLIETLTSLPEKLEQLMNGLQFSIALKEIWAAISKANKYIDETAPWILAKDRDKIHELAGVLYNLTESLRIISILIYPFMPDTSEKISSWLGIRDSNEKTYSSVLSWGSYNTDNVITKSDSLFPRIEKTEEAAAEEKDGKEQVTIDDFKKLDLRVAKITYAAKVENSDRLLVLKVMIGVEERQIVSGIADKYSPQELIGKKVIAVYNLKPATVKGIVSQGMLLAASSGDELSLVGLIDDIAEGAVVS